MSETNKAWAVIVVFAAEVLLIVKALTTVLGDITLLTHTIWNSSTAGSLHTKLHAVNELSVLCHVNLHNPVTPAGL